MRIRQPRVSAAIIGGPLAAGLRHSHNYVTTSGYDSKVKTSVYGWSSPSDPVRVSRPQGIGLTTTSSRQTFNPSKFSANNVNTTFLFHFMADSVGPLQALFRGISGGALGTSLYVQNDGTIRQYSDQDGGFVGSATTTALAVGKEYTVAWSKPATVSATSSIYVNGALEVTGISSTSGLQNTGFDAWGDPFAQCLVGAKFQFHAFERVLSAAEIWDWHRRRWQLFAEPVRRVVAPSAAAGGFFARPYYDMIGQSRMGS